VTIPNQTFIGVPNAIRHAGGMVSFEECEWSGCYRLRPTRIVDAACRFTRGCYQPGTLWCLSFDIRKRLPIGCGGMILTDDNAAAGTLRKMRYCGRDECRLSSDQVLMFGHKATLSPEQAARGLHLLWHLPDGDLPDLTFDYPDLSLLKNDCDAPLFDDQRNAV